MFVTCKLINAETITIKRKGLLGNSKKTKSYVSFRFWAKYSSVIILLCCKLEIISKLSFKYKIGWSTSWRIPGKNKSVLFQVSDPGFLRRLHLPYSRHNFKFVFKISVLSLIHIQSAQEPTHREFIRLMAGFDWCVCHVNANRLMDTCNAQSATAGRTLLVQNQSHDLSLNRYEHG